MTTSLVIPDAISHIVAAIRVHEDGSIAVHYTTPVAVGAVMADGRTFLGGAGYTGPFEIRVDRVLMIEVSRRARRLGRFEETATRQLAADRERGRPLPPPARAAAALPPIPGYRDPPAPRPQPIPVPTPDDDQDGRDPASVRFSLLELDGAPAPPALCDACGMTAPDHAVHCRRCVVCGAPDGDTCECE